MNTIQMLELTTIFSAQSSSLIDLGLALPPDALQRYWSCSRARLRIWGQWLDRYPQDAAATSAAERPDLRERTTGLLNELFVSELVTRVAGAVFTACDRRSSTCDAELVARNVLAAHQDVRQKGLKLMLDGPHVTLEQIAVIDCVRRRVERWTDLLLGHLVLQHGMHAFAFEPERALDFGTTQVEQPSSPRRNQVWQLYILCLQGAFADVHAAHPLFDQFRLQIARAMLACFPPELFGDDGLLKSAWLRRLDAPARDAWLDPEMAVGYDLPLPDSKADRPADSTGISSAFSALRRSTRKP